MNPTKVLFSPDHHRSECGLGVTGVLYLKPDTFIKAQSLQTFTMSIDKRNKTSQKSQEPYIELSTHRHYSPGITVEGVLGYPSYSFAINMTP